MLPIIILATSASQEKRFYKRETYPFIRISQLDESPSTLSLLPENLELRKGLII